MSRTRSYVRVALAGTALSVAAALGLAGGAVAGQGKQQRQAEEARSIRSAVERGQLLPLPRILALAQARVRGEVVKIELEHEDGRLIYEVKILAANGRIREVELDARTGALVKIEDD